MSFLGWTVKGLQDFMWQRFLWWISEWLKMAEGFVSVVTFTLINPCWFGLFVDWRFERWP